MIYLINPYSHFNTKNFVHPFVFNHIFAKTIKQSHVGYTVN
jgi:hypothetical protein